MREDILNIKNQSIARITEIGSQTELSELKVEFLGRKGKINKLIKDIKRLSDEDKKEAGRAINDTKAAIEQAIQSKIEELETHKLLHVKWFDSTVPGIPYKIGHLHPTTIVVNEMFDIFKHLGFSIIEGPEIESDLYNFEKLNLPKDHPARSLQDALYVEDPEVVLRTHTSSVEVRALSTIKPPFRLVVAGKCYRYEKVNASNNAIFYQFQGFSLQSGLSMADLKGTLFYFAKSFFGEKREFRFRCKYYPEVEPGAGLDINCAFCNKKGCQVCKGRGWIEMLGSGMIHPNILQGMGYDPKKISGFAFGMGLDRIVMDRFGIKDIRSLYNGDIQYDL